MELQPTVLVAMSGQSCRSVLIEHLQSAGLEVYLVESCREALAFLGNHPAVDLVLTEVSLPDGNWSDVVRYVVDYAEQASIVVTCSSADEQFWSEVLWRGVYDLLLEPCDASQVRRTVEGAIRHSRLISPKPPRGSRAGPASKSTVANRRVLARAAL